MWEQLDILTRIFENKPEFYSYSIIKVTSIHLVVIYSNNIVTRFEKKGRKGEIDTFLDYTNITRFMLKVNRQTRYLSGNNYAFIIFLTKLLYVWGIPKKCDISLQAYL